MKQYSDSELLSGLKSGDEMKKGKALRFIYKDSFPIVKSYILKNSGNEEDAADVFQDALIIFYEKIRLGQFELTSALQTYIYAVSRNIWLKRLKLSQKQLKYNPETEEVIIELELFDIVEDEDRYQKVSQALSEMGEACQKILMLYYFERKRMKEIAVNMNFKNEQGAKNKKSKCLKKIREYLNIKK